MDGAKKSLRPEKLESDYLKTKIIDKRVEDFNQANIEMLGKAKFKGSMKSEIDENFIFGVKTMKGDLQNVASCIYGQYKDEKSILPDPDLGKSVLFRSKLKALEPLKSNYTRSGGVPSIRNDLKKRKGFNLRSN